LGNANLKQSVGVDSSVQQLREVEVPSLENGIDETLTGVSRRGNFDWAWLLWGNRRLLGRCTALGLVIAAGIAFLVPKEFESTTRLMPPDSHSRPGLALMAALAGQGANSMGGSALGGIANDLLGTHDNGAVFTDMLRSRTVADRIIARFDLRKVYRIRYWEDTRKKLAERTAISQDRKSAVITIVVTDRDPNRATQLAQAYVDELDRISAEVNTSSARLERIFIEQRLKTVKQDLDAASQKFSEYSSKNATLDLKDQGKATVEAAAILQGQLIAAQSELEGLEQIYTANNVRVRSLQARVNELQRQLKKVGGDASNSTSVNPQSDQEFPSIRQLPLVGVRWADLYRETKIQETVYQLLTEQYEMAKIEEAKETPVVKVLDAPIVPERKSFPPRLLIAFLGMMAALISASVWVLGNAAWRDIDSGDPRKQLGQEIGARCSVLWRKEMARWEIVRRKIGGKTESDLNT
jgi:capsule polysaccharide export protein KpsE/RkpR